MKHILLIVSLALCTLMLHAETVWHRDVLTIEYGGSWLLDGYLSPLAYDGQQIGVRNEWWQAFQPRNQYDTSRWMHVGKLSVHGGRVISAPKNNLIYTLQADGGWGALHGWKWDFAASPGIEWSQLTVQVGPYLSTDVMAKNISANVNKPFSFDIGIDASALMNVQYAFRCKSTAYAVGYSAQMNLLGVEWQPPYWVSYYEVLEGAGLQEGIVCSHPANRQNFQQELHFDFQLKCSTWRLGVRHEHLRYGTPEIPFRRTSVSGCIGAIFNYKTEKALVINPF